MYRSIYRIYRLKKERGEERQKIYEKTQFIYPCSIYKVVVILIKIYKIYFYKLSH